MGDWDRYCCENWLNCCGGGEVGDWDRYCCENWLNCREIREVNNDDDDDNNNKNDNTNNNMYMQVTVCGLSSLFNDGF